MQGEDCQAVPSCFWNSKIGIRECARSCVNWVVRVYTSASGKWFAAPNPFVSRARTLIKLTILRTTPVAWFYANTLGIHSLRIARNYFFLYGTVFIISRFFVDIHLFIYSRIYQFIWWLWKFVHKFINFLEKSSNISEFLVWLLTGYVWKIFTT